MGLSLDALAVLDAIERRGSFAAAALELDRVPSAITYTVRRLEDELDVLLFDRRGHRARFTPAGRTLLDEGRRLLDAAGEIEQRVHRVATGWETQLRIAVDTLEHHRKIRASGFGGRVVTAYRPDPVADPEFEGFAGNVAQFGALTGENTATWGGYLAAHRNRRAYFKSMGATSTDHGHPTAQTSDLSAAECQRLLDRGLAGTITAVEAEAFRGQVLTEMASMSLHDGLVMQIHPGSLRNHNPQVFARFGRDKGADIPARTDYVRALRPLLDKYGNEPGLTVILFTLDESVYARELAPLAGHYPVLKLGPPWWFHDSPEGMLRFREQATETAGFYNTVGFNDDTRAFMSIPARHDVARRMDCRFLATLVVEHKIGEDEAFELAPGLAHDFAKAAYKL